MPAEEGDVPLIDSRSAEDRSLRLRPVTLTEARRFVVDHHRHNDPPPTWRFGVGVEVDGELVGVAMAARPVNRILAQDPYLLEVARTCTIGTPNANSMLYGAISRAAKALGYRKLITYTLPSESGSSLKAAGWIPDGVTDPKQQNWHKTHPRPGRDTLFGPSRVPSGPKQRWTKVLIVDAD